MERETTTVEVLGRRIHEIRGGSGTPLLYLHSAGGEAGWFPHLSALADRYELHAPAHPGFGTSEGIEAIRDIEDYVDHYLAYLEVQGWSSVAVVGHSLGGWIAAEIAARYPERVSALVLSSAVGIWLPEQPIADIFALDLRFPDRLRQLLFHDPECPAAQLMQMPGPGVEVPDAVLIDMMKAMAATARVGWNPLLHDPKLEGRLHRVTARTLCLWGDADRVVPLEYGERFAKRIAGAELRVIPACGHMSIFEKPEAWAEAVRAFLG